MTQEPYAVGAAGLLDRRQRLVPRRPGLDRADDAQASPKAVLVHLPIHASWLNQVEIFFSVLQRKAISPVDFADLDALAARILAFQDRYNRGATPFDWTFTRTDLRALLDRMDNPDPITSPAAA